MRANRLLALLTGLSLTAVFLSGCGGSPASVPEEIPSASGQIAQAPQGNAETGEQAEAGPNAVPGESIQPNGGEVISLSALEHQDATSDTVVYYTSDISPEAMVAIYDALGVELTGDNIAVKLSTGEPGSNYLRTDLIGDLVQSFDSPTIVECNTAYGGQRANTAMHYQVAEDHGYTAIADVDIMDENGSMTLPVTGGSNLTENYVGANFANYDYYVVSI